MSPLAEVHAQWDGEPTVVLSRNVRPGFEAAFETWAGGFSRAVAEHPGFRRCRLVPPVEGAQSEWVFVSTFESAGALKAWIASPLRRAWLERAAPMVEDTGRMRVISGLEALFGLPQARPPAVWKLAVVTQLGLYPTVLFSWTFLAPRIQPLGFFPRAFVSSLCTVVLMTWVVMPVVTRLFRGWLTQGD
jgi:uncharacterized protein